MLFAHNARAQEQNPYISYEVPFQNLLKFNRFLINPTFSTVRENKSYINFFHRSQAASFDDNRQDYFLSYSGRINDRTGLGMSLYNQQEGVISSLGAMINYAYGVRLAEKSTLTFGLNIPYYQSSFDDNRVITPQEDPYLGEFEDNSILAFQPGMNFSMGRIDVGMFAENLMDYNLESGQMITDFSQKTFSGHLQYTQPLSLKDGIMEDSRLMPLARIRRVGQNDYIFGGGLILDLPRLGWLQGGYDSFYGASVGTGFNLNRRLSLGYNIEKGLSDTMDNFGATHEVSLAFSFTPNLTENVVQKIAEDTNAYVINDTANPSYDALLKRMSELENNYEQNLMLLDELIYRQDSMELARVEDSERRFELVMRSVKRERVGSPEGMLISAGTESYTANTSMKQYSSGTLSEKIETLKTEIVTTGGAGSRESRFQDPKKLVIKKMRATPGIKNGHYVVANVFKTEKYLTRFMQDLKRKGLEPSYFRNPENGLNYVYLAHYQEDSGAMEAYRTGMGGKYEEQTWIMHVEDPRYSNIATLEYEE